MELLEQIINSLKETGLTEEEIKKSLEELKVALDEKLVEAPQPEELGADELEAKKAEVFGA